MSRLGTLIGPITAAICRRSNLKFVLRPTRTLTTTTTAKHGTEDTLDRPDTKKANSDDASFMDDTESGEAFIEREFTDMTVEDFKQLYENDQTGNVKDQIEIILQEYEYLKYNSMGRVPSVISVEDMDRCLVEANSPVGRLKFINYLFRREMVKRGSVIKKGREKAEKAAELGEKYLSLSKKFGSQVERTGLCAPNGDLMYGLWHNSLFSRIPEPRLKNATTESKLVQAALFGKKVIFDFDYENYMTHHAIRSSIEQVQEAYGVNRFGYREIFDLWFCNFKRESKSGQYLVKKCLPNVDNNSMITIKDDCFTNHFDKKQLVYLSPDSKTPLTDLYNDDIYIIGVFNDKGNVQRPISYRKAESLGIRSRSLPIDMYVAWQGGSKSLCLNHVLGSLLHCWNNGGNWRDAFASQVPARKLKSLDVVREEEERRRKRMKRKFSLREDLEF